MVEIDNLFKTYGPFTAVNRVSFSVDRGEVLGFLGPNGAGKSTTMKMITGFLTPDGGSVTVDGKDLAKNSVAVKKLMGYLPEGAPAYPDMTPASFLDFIANVRGLRGSNKKQRIEETIAKVNLENVLYQSIETLSKGFKRRVGLAQAILHDPDVLILDEPTDGLDPNQKYEVRSLIQNMAKEKVIILSTHILEEVDAVCTRAIVIANGNIVADGTPAELESKSPLHNSVTITLHGVEEDTVSKALKGIKSVKRVEHTATQSNMAAFQLFPSDGASIITDVSRLAQEKQWQIEELHVHKGRLDEVFRQITAAQQSLT